jgi:hypothetical protein
MTEAFDEASRLGHHRQHAPHKLGVTIDASRLEQMLDLGDQLVDGRIARSEPGQSEPEFHADLEVRGTLAPGLGVDEGRDSGHHQPFQIAGLRSHDTQTIINNVVGLGKAAKIFGLPTLLTTVLERQGGYILKPLQEVFPEQKPIDRTFINTWEDTRVGNFDHLEEIVSQDYGDRLEGVAPTFSAECIWTLSCGCAVARVVSSATVASSFVR